MIDNPIIVIRPTATGLTVADIARDVFAELQIASYRFVEESGPNQSFEVFWSGYRDGVEYRVCEAGGSQIERYPFWVHVKKPDSFEHTDQLTEQAHTLAEQLTQRGWCCAVRGYISATALET